MTYTNIFFLTLVPLMDRSIKLHSPLILSLLKKSTVASGNDKRVVAIATDDKAYNMTCLSHFMLLKFG